MSSSKANGNRKITIYDIAAEAGVSASTVSRVLTNNVKVNERKKQKVLELVDKAVGNGSKDNITVILYTRGNSDEQ